ncbi:MAG: hypothetical protein WD066_07140 [Planctomycetaceae bacterium]
MTRNTTMWTAVAALLSMATAATAADWSVLSAPGRLQTAQVQPVPEPMYIGPSGQVPAVPGYADPGQPVPGQPLPYGPSGSYGPVEPYPSEGMPLYQNVRYEDLRNVHPCAVQTVVMVPDPCADPCCGARCVPVQICVPPYACEEVKVSRGGDKIKYDYGKYQVEIRVKKRYIEVDYDD